MASDLDVRPEFIAKVANRSAKYYRVYTIPKRSGGYRTIFHPSPVLKTLQYWLCLNVFSSVPVSEHATAYQRGTSIKKNALLHLHRRHILHLDIKDFFPSITDEHVARLLTSTPGLGFTDRDLRLISGLCLYHNHLVVGSVSSPVISNAVLYPFDVAMADLCTKQSYRFSRYADDIYLSSDNYIPKHVVQQIEELLRQQGFTINYSKTYFMGPRSRKVVTGVFVDGNRLSVGRGRKEGIRRMLYAFLTRGEGDARRILGHLSFLRDVEPQTYARILSKYGSRFDLDLLEYLASKV